MQYTTVIITTTTAGIEPVTGSLLQLGITGFQIEDAADFQEFLESTTPHWDYVEESLMERLHADTTVTVYLPDNDQGRAQLDEIRSELDRLRAFDTDGAFGALSLELQQVEEADWENNWKQYFRPFPVGKRFLIRPLWENPEPDDRMWINIDPGCAFGSGQHHTTQLCLALLEDVVRPGDDVLDMGCGSGILSVAAALLGAQSLTAVDIEENAIRMTRENWEQNPTDVPLNAFCGNVLGDAETLARVEEQTYDVVAANIVADVLIAMAPLFPRWLRPDGTLVVSGIIVHRANEVLDTLHRYGFSTAELREQGEWAAARLKFTGKV